MNLLIKELCAVNSPSGKENKFREIIESKIDKEKNEITTDNFGNLIVHHKGEKIDKKICFFAFMDEASIIVKKITEDGFIKFSSININEEILPAKSFISYENETIGVINGKTWHLSTSEEQNAQPKAENLILDIGANSDKDAISHVSLGDSFVFNSTYTETYSYICNKASDLKSCCAVLIELLNQSETKSFYGAFISTHMVSDGGIGVAANSINADYGIILNSVDAGDYPISQADDKICKVNNGAVLSFIDERTVYDKELFYTTIKIAKDNNVSMQIKDTALPFSHSKALISSKFGVKVITLSLPCRYKNTPVTTIYKSDIHSCFTLSKLLLGSL